MSSRRGLSFWTVAYPKNSIQKSIQGRLPKKNNSWRVGLPASQNLRLTFALIKTDLLLFPNAAIR
jgi:hypothetical protein